MALVKFPLADVRPREPMGEASRAGHHMGSVRYKSGDAGAHLPFLLERANKQESRKRLEEVRRVRVA